MTSREAIPYADPLKAGRHPFQSFILSLSLVSGVPLIFGYVTAGSIEATLEPPLVAAWGVMLVGGSGMALLGSYWPKKTYDTGLTLERIGLWFTGVSAMTYGVIIIKSIGMGGVVAGCIVFAFGLACLVRARDIGRIFTRALEVDPPPVEREAGRDVD